MADDKLQDDELVREHLRNHDRLVALRAPWESLWREIDERVSPMNAGTIGGATGSAGRASRAGTVKGGGNFDTTAVKSLGRFAAAMAAITVPRNTQYIRLRFRDADLNKLPEVQRWCERTADRLHAIRYAAHAGFGVQSSKDFRQLGRYGTAPFLSEERKGVGLYYRALPLSECYIDEDFSGRVDTVHRRYTLNARQCEQQFGAAALTPKMAEAVERRTYDREFEILHIVSPNADMRADRFDWQGKPIASTYVAIDEKVIMRRAGYHSMPISVSRHQSEAGEIYGTSPAMEVLPAIKGVNVMKRSMLRATHKAVDPALIFFDDDGITSLTTQPGAANPGLVSSDGNPLVHAMPGGGANLPAGEVAIEQERADIRSAFMEEFFKILTDPGDRMTATQVLEMVGKQGVLVAPYAGQYETEKQNPVTQRDLDLAMRAGQVEPFPDVVLEAGAYPLIEYENPLTRMARAEEATGLTRWFEALTPMAQIDPGVFDHIDTDEAAPGLGQVLGVRPSWIATPEKVAAKRKARSDQQAAQSAPADLGDVAGAYLDVAKANQISEAA